MPAGQVQSVVTCRYDGKGRQITAADSTMSGMPSLSAYDAIGNVVESWTAGVTSYTDAKADRALMADGVTPAFDAVGNALRGDGSRQHRGRDLYLHRRQPGASGNRGRWHLDRV